MHPSPSPSSSEDAQKFSADDKIKTSHRSKQYSWRVALHWSKTRKGNIRRNNTIGSQSTRSLDSYPQKSGFQANCSDDSREGIDLMSHNDISHSGLNCAYFTTNDRQCNDTRQKRHSTSEHPSSTSLSHRYQPKSFQDIVGNEINIKIISNAVQRNKVAQLYLFHGPSGTGKTSTARIFAMALHCESTLLNKPCWTCRGCSRSLHIIELCSVSRTTGFQRINTLLQRTSFATALPGFKVFIIKDSHSLNAEAWEELLDILENAHTATLIFVLIAGHANMIPESISSRCQKFCFPRLQHTDVTLKLAKIIADEGIEIEEEALKLIVAKAEGSLKEAEYILDQLTLLGTRITSSMVQQLVGLIPQNKLVNLLMIALSGDTKKTIKTAKELVTAGFEAEAIVFHLASLIADILTGATIIMPNPCEFARLSKDEELLQTEPRLTNTQSESLCNALKILVEAEKQPRSSFDHINWVYAALLQIASRDILDGISTGVSFPDRKSLSSGSTTLYHNKDLASHHLISKSYRQQSSDSRDLNTTNESVDKTLKSKGKGVERECNLACMRDMDDIWLNILGRIQNRDLKEFLLSHVKLASLTVSSANAIVHLMFKRAEDKLAAQMSEESISKALATAIGCFVMVNMSLEPDELAIVEDMASSNKCQLAESSQPKKQQQKIFIPEPVYNANPEAKMHQSIYRQLDPSSISNPRLSELKDRMLKSEGHATREPVAISQMLPFPGSVTQENQLAIFIGSKTNSLDKDQFLVDIAQIKRKGDPKHQRLSLSSFQQNDASVEPYSQDILFENANKDKENKVKKNPKPPKGSCKVLEVHHLQDNRESIGLFRSWSCKELCQKKTKSKDHASA